MTALEVLDLSHSYNGHPALSGLSFQVAENELFCILGPTGSGKSTLFRSISTLLRPMDGDIFIRGEIDLIRDPAAARSLIGTVFQSPVLDPALTVRENLMITAALYAVPRSTASERIERLSAVLGVHDRLDTRVSRLSGGLIRRADLLRGLLHEPAILLLDEPTTGLDPAARQRFWQVIEQIREDGGSTILFTSHLMDEADIADRLMILDRGRSVAIGTSDSLREETTGHRIVVRSPELSEIGPWLRERFPLEVLEAPGALHLQTSDPESVFEALHRRWGSTIVELTLRKPTLEDIFFERTGSRWESADRSSDEAEVNAA
jgi:ABC-2 type transport system ATP-binding protein